MSLGDYIEWMWPLGHFLLNKKDNNNKLFMATGIWFPPVFYQFKDAILSWVKWKKTLLFWEKMEENLFYLNELNRLQKKDIDSKYEIYLSREKTKEYKNWYITKFLTEKNVKLYNEFYICGSSSVVNSITEKLYSFEIKKENIYIEKM